MKKILFTIFAAAATLLSSCSKDITEDPQSGASTFSIEIPGELSRATSGTSITRYIVEAYEAKNLSATPITAQSSTGSLSLTLKKNTEYTFLFWADGGADKYTATSLQDVKPTTPTAAGTRAFCLKKEFNSKDFEANKNIVLKGAVAQLNFIEKANLETSSNTIKVTYADLGGLNVASGVITPNATATPVARSFATTATTGTLASDYVLADRNGAVSDVKVQFNSETERSITAVTFKANYRTNLNGEFSNMYNSTITVTVDEEWSDPDFDNDLSYKGPFDWYLKGEITGQYEISTSEQLREFAKIVNGDVFGVGVPKGIKKDNFSEKTVTLTADIDLKNEEWIPIGQFNSFSGTFDGNGKTVSNLKIVKDLPDTYTGEQQIGLFGKTSLGTVKNLTIENTDISLSASNIYASYVGALSGISYNSLIMNVIIKGNLKIVINTPTKSSYLGGLCGLANGNTTFINCAVIPSAADYHLNIVGASVYMGGLVSNAEGNTVNCYSTANLKFKSTTYGCCVGALCGVAVENHNNYASGNIEGEMNLIKYQDYRIGGFAGFLTAYPNSFALTSKINVTTTGDATVKVVTDRICAYRYAGSNDGLYANPAMNYIFNGVENTAFTGYVKATDLTASPSAPWWSVPGGMTIVDKLNEYVTANPTYNYNGTTVTLKKWKTGTSKECPAVFVD